MAEIKINIDELESSIERLQQIACLCDGKTTVRGGNFAFNASSPEIVGGGKTVGEIEAIANLYQELNADLHGLINNTISFLENVKNSYVESDDKLAQMMKE